MFKKKLVSIIQDYFNVKINSISDPNSGYRNKSYRIDLENGEMVNFLLLKSEPNILNKIKNANWVGNYLASKNYPSRKTYCDSINKFISPLVSIKSKSNNVLGYACLYQFLPGETIPWEAYTSKHVKNLGGKMGEMHRLLNLPNDSRIDELPKELSIQKNNLKKMSKYFSDQNVEMALTAKLGIKFDLHAEVFSKLLNLLEGHKKSILHMDFVRGNILFDDKANITGVLDFEKVSYGPAIFDIARTLAFLVVDCKYLDEAKVRAYFLYNGYQKRGQYKLPPLNLLNLLIIYFLIYDFYKFLRHNPYEFLDQNEHFIRTKHTLIKYKILTANP